MGLAGAVGRFTLFLEHFSVCNSECGVWTPVSVQFILKRSLTHYNEVNPAVSSLIVDHSRP